MKILLLIYIPFILVYIYLYANIYSNNITIFLTGNSNKNITK